MVFNTKNTFAYDYYIGLFQEQTQSYVKFRGESLSFFINKICDCVSTEFSFGYVSHDQTPGLEILQQDLSPLVYIQKIQCLYFIDIIIPKYLYIYILHVSHTRTNVFRTRERHPVPDLLL